jgi:hypothetical protein
VLTRVQPPGRGHLRGGRAGGRAVVRGPEVGEILALPREKLFAFLSPNECKTIRKAAGLPCRGPILTLKTKTPKEVRRRRLSGGPVSKWIHCLVTTEDPQPQAIRALAIGLRGRRGNSRARQAGWAIISERV